MLRLDRTRLIVNIDDLRDYRRDFADGLLRQPVEFMPAFDDALSTVIQQVHNAEKHEIEGKGYHIGFSGSFGDHHVSPRNLRASYLGQMISLEGIVTRCSLVRPKMLRSVHFCPDTGLFHAREYRDATSSVTPQTDEEGHPLQMEFGFCTFRDHQRISIQEMPERAPAGQLPRSTDVILDDDLVDKCKPGDRIQLVGAYRSVGGGASGTFKYCPIRAILTLRVLTSLLGLSSSPTMSFFSLQKPVVVLHRPRSPTPTSARSTSWPNEETVRSSIFSPNPSLPPSTATTRSNKRFSSSYSAVTRRTSSMEPIFVVISTCSWSATRPPRNLNC